MAVKIIYSETVSVGVIIVYLFIVYLKLMEMYLLGY